MNQPYAMLTLASALREMFGVQLYKNNARALLSHILSILNLDWLQHAPSVRGVYEYKITVLLMGRLVTSSWPTTNLSWSKYSPHIMETIIELRKISFYIKYWWF